MREIKNSLGDEGHNKDDYSQKCFRRLEIEKSISNSLTNKTDYVKTTAFIV